MISLICSDLHGDGVGARRLQTLVERYHPDRIILLGDLYFSGGRWNIPASYDPETTFTVLRSLSDKILAIRGNCDREEDIKKSGLDFKDIRHLRVGDHIVFLIHDASRMEEPLGPGDILLSGHTHMPSLIQKDGIILANPGSLSWPRGGSQPSFLLMDERQITLYDFDGNTLASEIL